MFAAGKNARRAVVIIVLHARVAMACNHETALKNVFHVAPPEHAGHLLFSRAAGGNYGIPLVKILRRSNGCVETFDAITRVRATPILMLMIE